MKNYPANIFTACLVIALASLACQISVGGPTSSRTVPVSTLAVSELQNNLEHSLNDPNSASQITLTITESQLTSLLSQQLSKQPEPLLLNPQVLLQNNQVEIYGVAHKGSIQANARLAIQVSTDQNGGLTAMLTSFDLGPVPAPQSLVESISATINSALNEQLDPMTAGFRIDSVAISEGLMTLTGRRQQ
ncbi:MAG: hypothetical protein IT308_10455 [Anaerolineaceae bacterium]|nr:hypothetical protein [Anaerolineaceae bacterium]